MEFPTPQQAVFPQRRHGIRSGLAGPDGHDHRRRHRLNELVHDQCGQIVEQVSIVDEDQQAVGFGAGGQRGDDLACQRERRAFEFVGPLREGAERDRAAAARRSRASDSPTGVGCRLNNLASKPRFADTWLAGQRHSAVGIVPDQAGDLVDLLVPPDQGPVVEHDNILADRIVSVASIACVACDKR